MKKLVFTLMIAVACSAGAFAATGSVNTKMSTHFSKTFAHAKDVMWVSGSSFVKVNFVLDGEKMSAFYDESGDLLATSRTFAFDKLPKQALATLMDEYAFPAYQLTDCIEIKNANGEIRYYVSFESDNSNAVVEINPNGEVSQFA